MTFNFVNVIHKDVNECFCEFGAYNLAEYGWTKKTL